MEHFVSKEPFSGNTQSFGDTTYAFCVQLLLLFWFFEEQKEVPVPPADFSHIILGQLSAAWCDVITICAPNYMMRGDPSNPATNSIKCIRPSTAKWTVGPAFCS